MTNEGRNKAAELLTHYLKRAACGGDFDVDEIGEILDSILQAADEIATEAANIAIQCHLADEHGRSGR